MQTTATFPFLLVWERSEADDSARHHGASQRHSSADEPGLMALHLSCCSPQPGGQNNLWEYSKIQQWRILACEARENVDDGSTDVFPSSRTQDTQTSVFVSIHPFIHLSIYPFTQRNIWDRQPLFCSRSSSAKRPKGAPPHKYIE